MKTMFVAFALIVASNTHAEDPWCRVDSNPPKQRLTLDVQPSWFITADPNGRYVGVISSGNNVYDLDAPPVNGRPVSVPAPGDVDPVFTPDGRYLTNPGGAFYNADDIRQQFTSGSATRPRSIGSGEGSDSAYQSVGLLTDGQESSRYMYISDTREESARADLSYFVARVNHAERTLVTEKHGVLCPNIEEGHTPMISNDGHYLSILNPKTRSTQIYKVDENGGNCKMMVDTGIATGKVSFDFGTNPRRIAFHVDRHETNVTWFSGLGSGITKDTYVMNLDVQNPGSANESWNISGVQRLGIHNDESTGTYYPRWRKDGTLVAISVENTPRTIGNEVVTDRSYYLDVFDPARGATDTHYDPQLLGNAFCQDGTKLKDAAFAPLALAYLWRNACDKSGLEDRYRDSLLITPYLNHDACIQLVDNFWQAKRSAFLASNISAENFLITTDSESYSAETNRVGNVQSLSSTAALAFTADDIKSSCPAQHDTRTPATQLTPSNSNSAPVTTTPEALVMNKCGGCHNADEPRGGMAFMSGHSINNHNNSNYTGLNAQSASMALDSLWNSDKVDNLRMPPAGSEQLRPVDKAAITRYMLNFLSGPDRTRAEAMIRREGGTP